jgi:hypothetical protein
MPALSCTVHGCAAFATWPAGVELTKSICAILHELTGAGRGRRWEEASHRSCHCRSPGGQLHCAVEARTAGPSPVARRAEARHSAGRRHAAEGAHHCARRGESGSAGARPQARALGSVLGLPALAPVVVPARRRLVIAPLFVEAPVVFTARRRLLVAPAVFVPARGRAPIVAAVIVVVSWWSRAKVPGRPKRTWAAAHSGGGSGKKAEASPRSS